MPKEFLFGKTKIHKKHCKTEFDLKLRTAVSFLILFFGMTMVYVAENFFVEIPLYIALMLIIAALLFSCARKLRNY